MGISQESNHSVYLLYKCVVICLNQTLSYELPWAHRGWRMFNYLHQWKTWHLLNVSDSSESYKKPLSSLNLNHWLGNQKEYKYPKVYRKFFTIISFFKGSKQINTLEKNEGKTKNQMNGGFCHKTQFFWKHLFSLPLKCLTLRKVYKGMKKKKRICQDFLFGNSLILFFVWACHACII